MNLQAKNIIPMFALLNGWRCQSNLHKETQNKGVVGGETLCLKASLFDRSATAIPAYIINCNFQMLNEKNNYNSGNNSTLEVTYDARNALSQIKHNHTSEREKTLLKLLKLSKEELVDKFLVELSAKNKAYYFILENGLLNQFKNYCNETN